MFDDMQYPMVLFHRLAKRMRQRQNVSNANRFGRHFGGFDEKRRDNFNMARMVKACK